MRAPECKACGGTLADCRDVAMAHSGEVVVRKMRCVDCGLFRRDLTFTLPDEYDDIGFVSLTERLESHREAAYRARGKGAYRRTDTWHPADIRIQVSVTRRPRNQPKVGSGGWVVRGAQRRRPLEVVA